MISDRGRKKKQFFYPVFSVYIFVCVPLSREEWMLPADDLSVKEGGERRVLLRQTLDLEVAAQKRILQVNVLKKNGTIFVTNKNMGAF